MDVRRLRTYLVTMSPKEICSGAFPLPPFLGDSICRIEVGFRDIHFHFNKAGAIDVDGGRWQIHDASGTIVDGSMDVLPSTPQHGMFHVILEKAVTKVDIAAPSSFALTFFTGHVLTLYLPAGQ